MRELLHRPLRRHRFGALYLANFLFSFHLFLTSYYNSSFLGTKGIFEQSVGVLYIVASIVTILGIYSFSAILKKIGNYKTILLFTCGEFIAFLVLAFVGHVIPAILAFIAYLALSSLIILCSDIFLENVIEEEKTTGSIRGAFLTTTNIALVLAPFISGTVLQHTSFSTLYLLSAFLLIPFFFIISFRFRGFKDPVYEHPRVFESILSMRESRDVRNIFAAHLLLRIFFSMMVIYSPLYLHLYIGFTLSQIGLMFSIMLLPFALFEFPLGKIADNWLGEREILITGFVLLSLATGALSFVTSTSFVLWTLLLLLSRIGASAIEIATETYFFKHVDGTDANQISLFRTTRPLSDIIAPAIGSLVLLVLPLKFVFVVLGTILFAGVKVGSTLKDTR